MLFIGVDDTDSRDGGCTTFLANRILAAFPELRTARPPRLVRLNPNVPWKTRGNAAIALAFDDDGFPLDEARKRVRRVVGAHARLDRIGTDPGFAVTREPPNAEIYDATVQRIVAIADARRALVDVRGLADGFNAKRGVIGAIAALAWPAERSTFELIRYRERARWGTPRDVDAADVERIERECPTLFDSYDLVERDVVCVPASPCPILYGLRATEPRELATAAASIASERVAEETLFETNHASDDHLVDATVAQVVDYLSARVAVSVASAPQARGGHVFVETADATGELRLAAYAPTRSFRATLAALAVGDRLLACGGIHRGPDGRLTMGVEKLRLDSLESTSRKQANPVCACGARMKSAGRGAGYRCRVCAARAPPEAAPRAPLVRGLAEGWHEVPSVARRHLARPLKLGSPTGNRLPVAETFTRLSASASHP
ncbi:MAG: TiaS agmantine-binding domain-containing protein [Thermoplasmatota archaeon]